MRRRGSRWAGAGRGTRRAGEGWAGAGGLCAVSLSSLGDTEVSGRGHVPATAGAKRCPHARQRHSSASSPTLGQRHLPGCSRDPAGVRGTFSGPCSVWLGESHKDGEETEGEGTGRGFPHDGMVHGSHASSPCEMAPQRGTLQVHSPLRRLAEADPLPGSREGPAPAPGLGGVHGLQVKARALESACRLALWTARVLGDRPAAEKQDGRPCHRAAATQRSTWRHAQ